MKVTSSTAASLARLLAWDAPFLPEVRIGAGEGSSIELECSAPGCTLPETARWPLGQRLALATQLIAAGSFLYERGWLPSSRLLAGARAERGGAAPWLRLATLPRFRLDDPALDRRLRVRPALAQRLLAEVLMPLVRGLVPEGAAGLAEAVDERPAWEATATLLERVWSLGRAGSPRAHPLGAGRALWARRLTLPADGVWWVEEAELLDRLLVSARLGAVAAGRILDVAGGALDEDEVARVQARATAGGAESVVFTSLAAPGVPALPLAGGEGSLWVVTSHWKNAQTHARAALEVGEARPVLAAEILSAGAATGFVSSPGRPATDARLVGAASPAARRVLEDLRAAAAGLDDGDIATLGESVATVEELERLRLATRVGGRWRAVESAATASTERLERLGRLLPAESLASIVARAELGDAAPLVDWCERRVIGSESGAVLLAARAVRGGRTLALLGAEAALWLGRLSEADELLSSVGERNRNGAWHVLAAWWADQVGVPERLAAELAGLEGAELPPRLASRCEHLRAEQTRRRGDATAERRHLTTAVALSPDTALEASLALAALDGFAGVRRWRRALGEAWAGDVAARTYHMLGGGVIQRGYTLAAGTALRAALRVATGANPRLLGEVHADLGGVEMLADRPALAERHFSLAERLLQRCGSLRAVTIVQYSRAVLACDRLRWRECLDLIEASQQARGTHECLSLWLDEIERARALLARGDLEGGRGAMPRLWEAASRYPEDGRLRQACSALAAFLAIAEGDLSAAASLSEAADEDERPLILAVVRGNVGVDPPSGMPPRWGLTLAGAMLAAWRQSDASGARALLTQGVAKLPLETGVAATILVGVLARGGERPPDEWSALLSTCRQLLEDGGLDGWANRLETLAGGAPLRVLRAIAGLIAAGSDAFAGDRLHALASALHLTGLVIRRGDETVATWGEGVEGIAPAVEKGSVSITIAGEVDEFGRIALELVADHVSAFPGLAPAPPPGASLLLGGSSGTAAVREQIGRWAPLPLPVLVEGEPGTGKELVARELHRLSGRRGAFVPVNCAGLPATLLEREFFGTVRGAFTGADRDHIGLVEEAEGGTLFLDEIGEMPLEIQGKLLRLLQEREVRRLGSTRTRTVDVRFLAATNRDLKAAVAAGGFREDLYYRLAIAVITVPPLRERPRDIDEIAVHIVRECAAEYGRPGVRLAPAALAALRQGSWRGNVRELQSVLKRAVASARPGEVIGPDRFADVAPRAVAAGVDEPYAQALDGFRRSYFSALLEACGGNRTAAARRAGISRQTLLYHLRELGLK